jgi:hypothetical protein
MQLIWLSYGVAKWCANKQDKVVISLRQSYFIFADFQINYERLISDKSKWVRFGHTKWYYGVLSWDTVWLVGAKRAFHGMLKVAAASSSGAFLPASGFENSSVFRSNRVGLCLAGDGNSQSTKGGDLK